VKKIICFIFCLCIISFSGCKKESSGVIPITTGLSFTAEISYQDSVYTYDVTISKKSETELTALSDEIKGLKYRFSGQTLTERFNNLEHRVDISALPDRIITDFIHSVFLTVTEKQSKVISENDDFFITDQNDKYSFKIYFGETGLPLKIEDTKKGITATIKNATIL